MPASDYEIIRPALVGIKQNGQAFLLADEDSAVIAPSLLFRTAIPVGKAPSGTMGDNGALTVGTAFNRAYSDGIWLYFVASAVYSGSPAGFYWTVMSSTTDGTVYNNMYNPTTEAPYIPGSPTPIVATGPGAYTGVAASVAAIRIKVPGGLMGESGILRIDFSASNNNSATNKGVGVDWAIGQGGGYVAGNGGMTTSISQRSFVVIINMFANKQVATGNMSTSSSDVIYRYAADTTQDKFITCNLVGSTATDWSIFQHTFVEVIPS